MVRLELLLVTLQLLKVRHVSQMWQHKTRYLWPNVLLRLTTVKQVSPAKQIASLVSFIVLLPSRWTPSPMEFPDGESTQLGCNPGLPHSPSTPLLLFYLPFHQSVDCYVWRVVAGQTTWDSSAWHSEPSPMHMSAAWVNLTLHHTEASPANANWKWLWDLHPHQNVILTPQHC